MSSVFIQQCVIYRERATTAEVELAGTQLETKKAWRVIVNTTGLKGQGKILSGAFKTVYSRGHHELRLPQSCEVSIALSNLACGVLLL